MASTLAFLGRVADAEALGVHHVGALVDHGEGGFLGLGRVEPAVDEADGELDLGVDSLAPAMKAFIRRLTSGIGKPPTMPILLLLVMPPAIMPLR
jgi:hypothetical protein